MITRTAISTISYNSDYFLTIKLNELISQGVIEFYSYITHKPEEDEKKEHKHLYIVPSSSIDTFVLQKSLCEIDVANPDMPPLGVLMFRHSKFADWYLYAIHDIDYLSCRGESRKYHYLRDDIISSDDDYFNELVHTSDFSKYKNFSKLRECVASGVSFRELVQNGFVPIQQIIQYKKAYCLLRYGDMDFNENATNRGRYSGHDESVVIQE